MLSLAVLAFLLPEPLETALSHEAGALEFASGRIQVTEGEAYIDFNVVHDEAGEAILTLLAPAEEDLTEAESELWASWQDDDEDQEDSGDETEEPRTIGLYDAAALRASIGEEVRFEGEEDGLLLYSFTPHSLVGPDGELEEVDEIIGYLAGTVAVDPEAGHVAWIDYSARESFKPHMAVRIQRFSMRTSYTGSAIGPRLASMQLAMAGSAMFRRFDLATLIELVEAEFAPAD